MADTATLAVEPGQLFIVAAKLRNRSGDLWASEGPNPWMASYHWFDIDGRVIQFEGERTPLPPGGIQTGAEAPVSVRVRAPHVHGHLRLMVTVVREGVCWQEANPNAFAPALQSVLLLKPSAPFNISAGSVSARTQWDGMEESFRVHMTLSCRDSERIPKVDNAGEVFCQDGELVQRMHEGSLVAAGGYYGAWMKEIITRLRGHHEPQEELIFHHLLKHLRKGALIVELGCFWAYYSNWFLGAVEGSRALCIEPDSNNLAVGAKNLSLNRRSARLVNAAIAAEFSESIPFRRESDGVIESVPCWNFERVINEVGREAIDVLHIDAQGAELSFITSMPRADLEKLVRFLIVSTHHFDISGSHTMHRDCIAQLIGMGARILCEHTVEESFSGDGLIVASFAPADAGLNFPAISRNRAEDSLFGRARERVRNVETRVFKDPLTPAGGDGLSKAVLAAVKFGQMFVLPEDQVIGRSLLSAGTFEESQIKEVTSFLKEKFRFQAKCFVDIGANIGTHLVFSLKSRLFPKAIGFEADPVNFRLLKSNVLLNGVSAQSDLYQVALSDRVGMALLEVSPTNFGDHRIRGAGGAGLSCYQEQERETRPVVCDTLDGVLAEAGITLDSGCLVWIDTQGHEGRILAAAPRSVGPDGAKYVVLELWPYGIERSGGPAAYFEFLSRCRLIYDLGGENWQSRGSRELGDVKTQYFSMLSPGFNGGVSHTNLLCIL